MKSCIYLIVALFLATIAFYYTFYEGELVKGFFLGCMSYTFLIQSKAADSNVEKDNSELP